MFWFEETNSLFQCLFYSTVQTIWSYVDFDTKAHLSKAQEYEHCNIVPYLLVSVDEDTRREVG